MGEIRRKTTRRTAADVSAEERKFADDVGFFWEEAGGTRMAGRVLGALLLADPPEMSSSDLARLLGVSAGSVSTATRELINPGVVTRVRVPGQRQDYFRSNMGAGALPQFLRMRVELTHRWARLMERGSMLADGKDPSVRGQLEEIQAFYEFLEVETASILERWEQLQSKRRAGARSRPTR